MKKFALILATAGLMSMAACTKSPEAQNVVDAGDNAAMALENTADNLEAMADNATGNTAAGLENAADNADAMADNVQDKAEDKADAIDAAKK